MTQTGFVTYKLVPTTGGESGPAPGPERRPEGDNKGGKVSWASAETVARDNLAGPQNNPKELPDFVTRGMGESKRKLANEIYKAIRNEIVLNDDGTINYVRPWLQVGRLPYPSLAFPTKICSGIQSASFVSLAIEHG